VFSHPLSVPLPHLEKYRRICTDHKPHEFRLITEMDDIAIVVLFFDRHTILWAFLDKSSYLGGVGCAKWQSKNGHLSNHCGIQNGIDQFLEFRSLITKPPDRPFGIFALLRTATLHPFTNWLDVS
jgi:hypothetical protein